MMKQKKKNKISGFTVKNETADSTAFGEGGSIASNKNFKIVLSCACLLCSPEINAKAEQNKKSDLKLK